MGGEERICSKRSWNPSGARVGLVLTETHSGNPPQFQESYYSSPGGGAYHVYRPYHTVPAFDNEQGHTVLSSFDHPTISLSQFCREIWASFFLMFVKRSPTKSCSDWNCEENM